MQICLLVCLYIVNSYFVVVVVDAIFPLKKLLILFISIANSENAIKLTTNKAKSNNVYNIEKMYQSIVFLALPTHTFYKINCADNYK